MMLHTLFSTDESICLYCKSECSYSAFGEALMVSDTYTCNKCDEKFVISGMISSASDECGAEVIEVDGFTFTCNGISSHSNYDMKQFGLKKISKDDWKSPLIWIPEFAVDFSDKEGLFKKLKIYLTFA